MCLQTYLRCGERQSPGLIQRLLCQCDVLNVFRRYAVRVTAAGENKQQQTIALKRAAEMRPLPADGFSLPFGRGFEVALIPEAFCSGGWLLLLNDRFASPLTRRCGCMEGLGGTAGKVLCYKQQAHGHDALFLRHGTKPIPCHFQVRPRFAAPSPCSSPKDETDKHSSLPNPPSSQCTGADLRQDQIALHILGVMDRIWRDAGLEMEMSLYRVLCTGYEEGLIQATILKNKLKPRSFASLLGCKKESRKQLLLIIL